ncbi:MAG: electron transfer flavoprotein subunit alpha/FixB family protein [Candidatus Binatia bacterium]
MAGNILVLVEHADDRIDSVTFQLLNIGRQLANDLKVQLIALAVGHPLDNIIAGLQGRGMDKIIVLDDAALAMAGGEVQAQAIAHIARQIEARLILLGYSLIGMELAPAIAVQLGINALTNCVNLKLDGGAIVVTKPVFDSTLHVEIALDDGEGAVIGLQKGSFAPIEASSTQAAVQCAAIDVAAMPSHSKVLAIVEEPTGDVDITKAEIVVSVGRGIGSAEKIPLIAELAEALGGVLACSRPVVDVGWLPRERQVGASGRTVTPKIYIACGISGAIQHLIGMREANRIIAINKDLDAPIFGVAHIGVVGDLFEIVPALTKAAKDAKAR